MNRKTIAILPTTCVIVLGVAWCAFWSWSYVEPESVTVTTRSGPWTLRSDDGWLTLARPAPPANALPVFTFPYWPVAVVGLAAGVPAFLTARRQQQRRKRGTCRGCGYDLRASANIGRCPECGRAMRRPTYANLYRPPRGG